MMNLFYKKMGDLFLISILVFTSIVSSYATAHSSSKSESKSSTQLAEIKTRPGVTQKFYLINPDNPVACVILFAGGDGDIGLSSFLGKPTINELKNNFLVSA